jgi:predicted transcriptional regulator
MAGIATMPIVAKAGGQGMKAHVVYFALSVAVLTLAGFIHFVTRLP